MRYHYVLAGLVWHSPSYELDQLGLRPVSNLNMSDNMQLFNAGTSTVEYELEWTLSFTRTSGFCDIRQ